MTSYNRGRYVQSLFRNGDSKVIALPLKGVDHQGVGDQMTFQLSLKKLVRFTS